MVSFFPAASAATFSSRFAAKTPLTAKPLGEMLPVAGPTCFTATRCAARSIATVGRVVELLAPMADAVIEPLPGVFGDVAVVVKAAFAGTVEVLNLLVSVAVLVPVGT